MISATKLPLVLNKPGSDRLGAMWETIFLYASSKIGKLTSEQALATGKKPDIRFSFLGEAAVGLIADITAVSGDGLDKGMSRSLLNYVGPTLPE
ncbi:hypothetical protein [Bradyrhizobium sp. 191]|uniref:hypothetical protein n=1 Tax=Bradyrhizobium sp. 191 TaxID=2782659 RepID=UPI001FFFBC1B|nr:hypothetical protein [Bradyrhizobium sp. 191]UPJ63662.1 hypothetical protein IVB23_27105 [Bradyrhizobium sp. 191]